MLVKEFDYTLPDELIARFPAAVRDSSRLMVLSRRQQTITESVVTDLPDYIEAGDVVVLNDTRVIPARLLGTKESGGKVEIFLLRRDDTAESEQWLCLLKASKRFRVGQQVCLPAGMMATLISNLNEAGWLIRFEGTEPFDSWLEREGHIPLPPYLGRSDQQLDKERYQTVFAHTPGAVAAPTAGLHLTNGLLDAIRQRGAEIVTLTLHTGLGTFLPVRVEKVVDHRIHVERYQISEATARAVNSAKSRGKRVIAIGTTTARTLEYASDSNGLLTPGNGEADIFIYPGYRFKIVDALLTNFHLPESTLLMLVSALAGREWIMQAYQRAIASRYRFYSYGDAMLIV